MKSQRSLITGLALALVLSASSFAQAAQNWAGWMENYYLNPDTEKVVPAVYALSRSGHFEQAGQPAAAIGFLGAVFAQNPDKVAGWVNSFRDLPTAHQRIVAAALWYSGLPEGAEHLRALARSSRPEIRAEVESLTQWAQPSLRETPVLSESSLNLQWGAFLGSGDSRHVVNVLAALGSSERALNATVRTALAEKALAHPRVYEIRRARGTEHRAAWWFALIHAYFFGHGRFRHDGTGLFTPCGSNENYR
jgi:hypothetical protein